MIGWPYAAVGGVVVGAVLAAAGLAIGSNGGSDTPAASTTTSSTLADQPEPVEAATGLVPGARIVATALEFTDSGLALDFEMVPLGGPAPVAVPSRWLLTGADGSELVGQTANADARRILFDAPEGFLPEQLQVTMWRLQTPLRYAVDIPRSGELVELADGTRVGVARVLEQSTGSIVQFDVELGDDAHFDGGPILSFGFFPGPGPFLSGAAPDWEGSAALPAAQFGRPQLTHHGPVPDPLSLTVRSAVWAPHEGEVAVTLPEVRP